MTSAWLGRVLFVLAFVLGATSDAVAQPHASSLDDLRPLTRETTHAIVTDRNNQRFRGTIAEASASALVLRIGGTMRRFAAEDVQSVRIRKRDSPWNGGLIGALVGGGLTSLIFLDNECRDDPACYKAVGAYAGVGALVGVGIDALIRSHIVIYTAGTAPAPRAVGVAPIVGRGLKGARVTVRF
jgi:hypothetical protein